MDPPVGRRHRPAQGQINCGAGPAGDVAPFFRLAELPRTGLIYWRRRGRPATSSPLAAGNGSANVPAKMRYQRKRPKKTRSRVIVSI
jgi:hypothetical protein